MTTIKEQFPEFNLEDKVAVSEGSNVRTENKNRKMTGKVYHRRNIRNR